MNEEIARVVLESCTGETASVALLAPCGEPPRTPWLLDCRTTATYAEAREWRKSLGAGYAQYLLRELDRARVPARPAVLTGCDGETFELTLTQGFNKTVYRWWCGAPKGYEPLVTFCNALFELGGMKARAYREALE